jgi:hypothetical protein
LRRKATEQWETAASGSSGETHSMVDDVVASFGWYIIDNAMQRSDSASVINWFYDICAMPFHIHHSEKLAEQKLMSL